MYVPRNGPRTCFRIIAGDDYAVMNPCRISYDTRAKPPAAVKPSSDRKRLRDFHACAVWELAEENSDPNSRQDLIEWGYRGGFRPRYQKRHPARVEVIACDKSRGLIDDRHFLRHEKIPKVFTRRDFQLERNPPCHNKQKRRLINHARGGYSHAGIYNYQPWD